VVGEVSDPLTIIHGDALSSLRTLRSESVQCAITSPPYWNLRDYGHDSQIGLEKTPRDYVAALVEVLRELKRVMRTDGSLWLNLGDSYFGDSPTRKASAEAFSDTWNPADSAGNGGLRRSAARVGELKPKDLCMIPARVAIALQDDGWFLRSEITWCKRAPMPESVRDRPTSATEKVYLLTKSPRYLYNNQAVRYEPLKESAERLLRGDGSAETNRYAEGAPGQPPNTINMPRPNRRHFSTIQGGDYGRHFLGDEIPEKQRRSDKQRGHSRRHAGFNDRWDLMEKAEQLAGGANLRNYWIVGPDPFPEAHFATFPREIPRRCILLGSNAGDLVIDPFAGSGTTGKVAIELGRKAILIEPKAEYVEMIKRRCQTTIGLPLTYEATA
jgi:DNA modification methylase